MEELKNLIKEISNIKLALFNSSVLSDEMKLTEYLNKFAPELRYRALEKEIEKLNNLIFANIKELDDHLEIFADDENGVIIARKESSKLFSEEYKKVFEYDIVKNIIENKKKEKKVLVLNNTEYQYIDRIVLNTTMFGKKIEILALKKDNEKLVGVIYGNDINIMKKEDFENELMDLMGNIENLNSDIMNIQKLNF